MRFVKFLSLLVLAMCFVVGMSACGDKGGKNSGTNDGTGDGTGGTTEEPAEASFSGKLAKGMNWKTKTVMPPPAEGMDEMITFTKWEILELTEDVSYKTKMTTYDKDMKETFSNENEVKKPEPVEGGLVSTHFVSTNATY